MADFFEELGKRVSDVAADIGKFTEDTIEMQKIKSELRTRKRDKERDLIEIGGKVYDKFLKGEITDSECISLCESVEEQEEKIGVLNEKISRIREGM